jgi:hypothetical protein
VCQDDPVDSLDEKLGPLPLRQFDPEFFGESGPDFVVSDSVGFDVPVSLPVLCRVDLERVKKVSVG